MDRRRWMLVLAVLVLPVPGESEDHKWAAYAAYSTTKTGQQSLGASSVWNGGLATGPQVGGERSGRGWHVAAEVTLKLPWLFDDNIAFVGDASGHLIGDKDEGKRNATQFIVMVGPRIGLRLPGEFHVFTHFMGFGAIHRSDSRLDIDTSTMALAVGGGVDFTPFNKGTGEHGHDGLRIQIDRVFAVSDQVDGSWRYSFGYVHRFD